MALLMRRLFVDAQNSGKSIIPKIKTVWINILFHYPFRECVDLLSSPPYETKLKQAEAPISSAGALLRKHNILMSTLLKPLSGKLFVPLGPPQRITPVTPLKNLSTKKSEQMEGGVISNCQGHITSRIDSDYPSTTPFGPFPGTGNGLTASPESDVRLADGCTPAVPEPSQQSAPPQPPITFTDSSAATGGGKEAGTTAANAAAQHTKLNDCDVDFNKTNRHDSIESKKSKSLSVDLNEVDSSGQKKDVKKTKSDPSAQRAGSEETKEEGKESNGMTVQDEASPLKDNSSSPRSPRSSDGATRCADDLSALLPSPLGSKGGAAAGAAGGAVRRLRAENERLQAEVTRLRRLVRSYNGIGFSALKADKRRLKAEKFDLLNQMKQLYLTLEDKEKELRDFIRNYGQKCGEAVETAKHVIFDCPALCRRRSSYPEVVQEKGRQQTRDNESSLQQLCTEREERERERWSLLRHARDEAERSLSLAAQLNAKELQLQQAHEQLQEARRQLQAAGMGGCCLSDQESLASLPRHSINGGLPTAGAGGITAGGLTPGSIPHHPPGGGGDRGSCSADSGVRVSSDRESGATSVAGNLSDSTDGAPTIAIGECKDIDSVSLASTVPPPPPPHMYQSSLKDCSPTLSPLNANNFSRSIDPVSLSRSVEQLSSPLETEPVSVGRRSKQSSRPSSGRGGTWGSISRVFARSRHRNKTSSLQESSDSYDNYRSWSPLTEEGYAEKLRLLREAGSIPMERWRAPTVLAWLEIALGMPQYGSKCSENIKSGKIGRLNGQVLLELSDLELECGLGIQHPMHRKKLRLAIEEHRNPQLVRYPCLASLGHTWVSSEWLPDLGLAQYSDNFAQNMVDARMLEHLSKKELEKYLGVTRKFHQASIVHGIHLLRIMKYDRQALAVRRHQSENMDADPLVWTNQRFIRWARSIDLGEYADNLKDSGVHGGLVVLEPSFNGDTMATALGIPASKSIIRRHLTAELDALVLPARSTLEQYVRVRTKSRVLGGSLGRSFSRSCGSVKEAHAQAQQQAAAQAAQMAAIRNSAASRQSADMRVIPKT
nr:unnamed protein product [Callosobruchus chinensis]